jgi:hypothetical protein
MLVFAGRLVDDFVTPRGGPADKDTQSDEEASAGIACRPVDQPSTAEGSGQRVGQGEFRQNPGAGLG